MFVSNKQFKISGSNWCFMGRFHQGLFKPQNPQKYKGDVTNIIYRSSWELRMLMHLDRHPDVLQYSSEEIVIPYRSPIDGKVHRYFPDFWIKQKNRNGVVEELLVEVKPASQTQPPVPRQGKPTRKYLKEVYTWGVNSSKWEAAESYCAAKGWKFVKITEKDLNITI